jgi:hypothetical protein
MNYNWPPESMGEMTAIRFRRMLDIERQMIEARDEAEARRAAEADHAARVAAAMQRR